MGLRILVDVAKVVWDQPQLAEIAQRIAAAGDKVGATTSAHRLLDFRNPFQRLARDPQGDVRQSATIKPAQKPATELPSSVNQENDHAQHPALPV